MPEFDPEILSSDEFAGAVALLQDTDKIKITGNVIIFEDPRKLDIKEFSQNYHKDCTIKFAIGEKENKKFEVAAIFVKDNPKQLFVLVKDMENSTDKTVFFSRIEIPAATDEATKQAILEAFKKSSVGKYEEQLNKVTFEGLNAQEKIIYTQLKQNAIELEKEYANRDDPNKPTLILAGQTHIEKDNLLSTLFYNKLFGELGVTDSGIEIPYNKDTEYAENMLPLKNLDPGYASGSHGFDDIRLVILKKFNLEKFDPMIPGPKDGDAYMYLLDNPSHIYTDIDSESMKARDEYTKNKLLTRVNKSTYVDMGLEHLILSNSEELCQKFNVISISLEHAGDLKMTIEGSKGTFHEERLKFVAGESENYKTPKPKIMGLEIDDSTKEYIDALKPEEIDALSKKLLTLYCIETGAPLKSYVQTPIKENPDAKTPVDPAIRNKNNFGRY